jgi:formylglycine-generating enzyme required for sulfatase activity
MIDPASAIAIFKLATWGMRFINENVKFNNLTQKKSSATKSSSSAISKIDRQLKDAELKYYQDKTKRDRALLAIDKQKLANDNIRIEIEETRLGIDADRLKLDKQRLVNDNIRIEIDETRLEIDVDRLKLEKQERRDRLEISRLHRELLKEIQVEETQVKLHGIQTDWDKDTWFSKISREKTKAILTKYNHRLLILTSPLYVDPYFENSQDFQQWSFDRDLRKVDKFLSQHYSPQSAECPVQFYYDYFREKISKIDTNRLQDLLSSVATYVLYCDIDGDSVNFWVVHWQTQQPEATHFAPFEWNWREDKDRLMKQGQSEVEAIRSVKQTIIEIHRLLAAYLADIYYLMIDPFYEPQLPKVLTESEQPILQPYVALLTEFQVQQVTAYERELALREDEYWRQEAFKQQELAQQRERATQEQIRQNEELKGELFSFTVPTVNDTGTIVKQTSHEARCLTIDLGSGVSLEMVYVPGGTFLMGGSHQVTIVTMQPFYMGKYAITQAQYLSIMGDNPARFKGDNRPVEQVSWDDAQVFIRGLSIRTTHVFRLPSESEWEYACRAGTTTVFCFGETITPELVNYDGNYTYGKAAKGKDRQETTPVGSFPPNQFGLYDMHGNVWEWCMDNYQSDLSKLPNNGSVCLSGDSSYRVMRGGSWNYDPVICCSATRLRITPDSRDSTFGFRVACEMPRTL